MDESANTETVAKRADGELKSLSGCEDMRFTCVERTAACDLQSSGGRRVIRNRKEIFNTRHGQM